MRILAIETSCDETGVCLIEAAGDYGAGFSYTVLGNALLSQTETHAPYGGVFPNLARREHEKNLVPLMTRALADARLLHAGSSDAAANADILTRETELRIQLDSFLAAYGKPEIDAIAVTQGPGLEPALWVGVNFARALSSAWQLPLVPVNHMEGHIILSMMKGAALVSFDFPLLSLLISGGHTELVLSKEWQKYELIGATRDDAAGEAFDKAARLLDLPYPGGPEISRLAREARMKNLPRTIALPRPMLDTPDYDFSFSGLKTAVRRLVEAHAPLRDAVKMEIAREFEDAAADVLVAKTMRAAGEYGARTILVGGGVSANEHIRERLASAIDKGGHDATLLIPPAQLATDNALMIALAGHFRAARGGYGDAASLRADGNLALFA